MCTLFVTSRNLHVLIPGGYKKNGERSNRGLFACGFFRVATELGRTDAEVLTEAVGKVGAAAESTFGGYLYDVLV